MSEPLILIEKDSRGVARMTMNRPDLRNAFNGDLIAAITENVTQLGADPSVRVIVLTGSGKAFSAGADLNMMREVASYTREENIEEGNRLAAMLSAIDQAPKPVIALVNGPALGGGVGLIAASNIAIGSEAAFFALSEARLGLIPAVISPFVIRAIGARQAERYFLTAERFDAATAKDIGLLHLTAPADALESVLEETIDGLLQCSPNAQFEAKQLIKAVSNKPIDAAMMADVAERIARLRASDEGKEGVTAFLEKRKASWIGRSNV
ncbi:MAG: enoyl-CoA hydratase/isomerase family protein [Pseudomonadota bacterium]